MSRSASLSPLFEASPTEQHPTTLVSSTNTTGPSYNALSTINDHRHNLHHHSSLVTPSGDHSHDIIVDPSVGLQPSQASSGPRLMFLDPDEMTFEDAMGGDYEEEYEEVVTEVANTTTLAFPASPPVIHPIGIDGAPSLGHENPTSSQRKSLVVGVPSEGPIIASPDRSEMDHLRLPSIPSRRHRSRRQHPSGQNSASMIYSNPQSIEEIDHNYAPFTDETHQHSSQHLPIETSPRFQPQIQHQSLPPLPQQTIPSYSDTGAPTSSRLVRSPSAQTQSTSHWDNPSLDSTPVRPGREQLRSRRSHRHHLPSIRSSHDSRDVNGSMGGHDTVMGFGSNHLSGGLIGDATTGSRSSRPPREHQHHRQNVGAHTTNQNSSHQPSRSNHRSEPDHLFSHIQQMLERILLQPFRMFLFSLHLMRSFSVTSVNFLRFLLLWFLPALTIWLFCLAICCLFFVCCYGVIYYLAIPDRIRTFPVYFDYHPRPQSLVDPFVPLYSTPPPFSPPTHPPGSLHAYDHLPFNAPYEPPLQFQQSHQSTQTASSPSCPSPSSSLFSWFRRSSQTCPASPQQTSTIESSSNNPYDELLSSQPPTEASRTSTLTPQQSHRRGIVLAAASSIESIEERSGSIERPVHHPSVPRRNPRSKDWDEREGRRKRSSVYEDVDDGDDGHLDEYDDDIDRRYNEHRNRGRTRRRRKYDEDEDDDDEDDRGRGFEREYRHEYQKYKMNTRRRQRRKLAEDYEKERIQTVDDPIAQQEQEEKTKNIAVAFITFDNRTWESSPDGFSFKEYCMHLHEKQQEGKKAIATGLSDASSADMVKANTLILGYDTDVSLILEHAPYVKLTSQQSYQFSSSPEQTAPLSRYGNGNTFIITSPNGYDLMEDHPRNNHHRHSYDDRQSQYYSSQQQREQYDRRKPYQFHIPPYSAFQQSPTSVSSGSFVVMFTLELFDSDCMRVARSTRPHLIFPRSVFRETLQSIINYLPVLFNLYQSTVEARVNLIEGISYNNEKGLKLGRLMMTPPVPAYSAQLIFETRLIGVRRLMRDHRFLSLFVFVFVATLATAPLLTCCCFAAYARAVRSLSSTGQYTNSMSSQQYRNSHHNNRYQPRNNGFSTDDRRVRRHDNTSNERSSSSLNAPHRLRSTTTEQQPLLSQQQVRPPIIESVSPNDDDDGYTEVTENDDERESLFGGVEL